MPTAAQVAGGRPLREIARQPVFIIAVAAAALGYGVMNLLMAATPIAMAQCSHPFSAAALVLEWHVLGMFVPSFFTGHLIRRFGTLPVMTVGLLLNIACVAFALSGTELMHFMGALFVLGVGWNFLYIGGTTLAGRDLPARGAHHRAGRDGLLRLHHDDGHVLQLRRAGHDWRLDLDEPGQPVAAGAAGCGPALACQPPACCAQSSYQLRGDEHGIAGHRWAACWAGSRAKAAKAAARPSC